MKINIGDVFPDFKLNDENGEEFDLEKLGSRTNR